MLEAISIKQALEETWLGGRREGSRAGGTLWMLLFRAVTGGRGSDTGKGGSNCWRERGP